jgi:hypothetical protein
MQLNKDYVAPEDMIEYEHANFICGIVRQILDARRGDNFASCTALVGTAAVLANNDPAHRVALAHALIKIAMELDPDCGVVRWQ